MTYKGLNSSEIEKLLKEYWFNELKAKKKNPWWKLLLQQFSDILVIILVIAALITLLHWEIVDATVILFIIVLNAWIGFFQ